MLRTTALEADDPPRFTPTSGGRPHLSPRGMLH